MTDTVGFIRRLPTQLVQGFASTLEETLVADLILHVVDASLTEDRMREQIAAVDAVLTEIGGDDLPIVARAQQDRPARPARAPPAREPVPGCAPGVGGRRGRGSTRCASASRRSSPTASRTSGCSCPTTRGHALSALYALGAPIDERRDTDAGVLIRAKLSHRDTRRFARYLVAGDDLESAATT